jgi:hypothetical protein
MVDVCIVILADLQGNMLLMMHKHLTVSYAYALERKQANGQAETRAMTTAPCNATRTR